MDKDSTNKGEVILSRMALNDNKAGMEGLDRDKINAIILETSKGSRFYENELKRDQQVNQRIEKMMLQKASISEEQLQKAQLKVEKMVTDMEKKRDLSRIIVHVDMDAFYAAVEMRDSPELKDKPMAVGSMSMLSTSNYHARKYGVRAAMPGFIAKKLCPTLVIVPTNFDKYRAVSKRFKQYLQSMILISNQSAWMKLIWTSRAPGTEKELDSPTSPPALASCESEDPVGKACEVFGTSAEEAVREMRFRIEQKTQLTASAGIAPNMMLAKVCSDKNKPNGQYRLPPTRDAVMDFIHNLPVRKVPGIGKVSEKMLKALGICNCSDLGQQMALLSMLFSETAWHHFMELSLGLSPTFIPKGEERKSMSTERTFKELSRPEEQFALCRELCEDLAEDMKKEGLKGKTVTVKLKNVHFEVKTRAMTLQFAVATAEEIFAIAKDLLKTEMENVAPHLLRLRLMGFNRKVGSTEQYFQFNCTEHIPFTRAPTIHFILWCPSSKGLTCPVCFCQVNTTNLNVFNNHIDLCLKGTAARTDQDTDSEPDLSSQYTDISDKYNSKEKMSTEVSKQDFSQNTSMEGYENGDTSSSNNDDEGSNSRESKCPVLVCPVCHKTQDTNDLTAFNHHVDLFNNQLMHKTTKGKTKRRDSPSSLPRKNPKGSDLGTPLTDSSDNEPDQSFDNKEMLLLAEKQFIEAAKRNDIETMKVVGKGLNANAKNVDQRTALHFAVARKNKEAVQLLLQRRVKVDPKDKHGVTPIHLAAWFGSLDILKLLVKAGAEQKIENEDGLNILHCAAINNHTDIVEYIVNDLIMKELDKEDRLGQRPFSLAAKHGCMDMLEMLKTSSYNMDTMEPNKRGDTPLHLAASNGHGDTVQLLLLSFDTRNEVNKDGETALYQAAENGHEECVKTLLESDCDLNIVTNDKRSALHTVAEKGDSSLVQLLLAYEAHTECSDQNLQTPLHLAVKNGHLEVISCLLDAGCNYNAADKMSQTAMHIAAEMGKVEVAEMLLLAGINLSLQDKQERYNNWKETNPELNQSVRSEFLLTFKLDHRHETKQLRSTTWHLAHTILKPGQWKKLAEHWGFTKQQVEAIDKQWAGQNSYQEHGNRMLLIWLHGVELANENPIRELYQSLVNIDNQKAADKIRMEPESGKKKCIIS
ncbi:hypothetical protein WMY93_004456 [Mugilogobius chulae]|uniref:DNA polymerase kappa n=1 Tax=Mugilogobius chulae TaxID=88201 RepID=A0AAW0Q3I3_9GOBI